MTTMFLRFPGGKSKAVTFSYDDGVEEDIRLIEIFRKNGLRGTFNLNSGLFGPDDGSNPGSWHRRLSRKEVTEVYTEDVCEVACHCVSHPYCTSCNPATFTGEVLDDRRNLEALFGRQIHGLAYPYGVCNDTVVEICKNCGIYYARTTECTHRFSIPKDWLRMSSTCRHKDPELMNLTRRFADLKPQFESQVFSVWGHSYEFADDNNWELIEEMAETISGKDDIWYATNMEIYLAWQDFTRLEYSADGKSIYNPSPRTVWLADKRQNFKIEPGETLLLP